MGVQYIPLGNSYDFNYAVAKISPDNKYSVLVSTNKNYVAIYDNSKFEEKEYNGDVYKIPTEVKKLKIED